MPHAQKIDGTWQLITGGFEDANGTAWAANVVDLWSGEELAEIGVYEVSGDLFDENGRRLAAAEIVEVEGHPIWRPLSTLERRAELRRLAEIEYDARRQSPMAWNFGSVAALDDNDEDQGAAGEQTLQMRVTGPHDDQKNWMAAAQGAALAVGAGAGSLVQPLKTSANVWVQTTASQVLQVLVLGDGTQQPAFTRGIAMLKAYGRLKKAIDDAPEAELDAINVTEPPGGWPE